MKKTTAGGEAPFKITKVARKAGDPATAAGSGCSGLPGDGSDKPPC